MSNKHIFCPKKTNVKSNYKYKNISYTTPSQHQHFPPAIHGLGHGQAFVVQLADHKNLSQYSCLLPISAFSYIYIYIYKKEKYIHRIFHLHFQILKSNISFFYLKNSLSNLSSATNTTKLTHPSIAPTMASILRDRFRILGSSKRHSLGSSKRHEESQRPMQHQHQ
jgi:hypothetical protein